MMRSRTLPFLCCLAFLFGGCTGPTTPAREPAPPASSTTAATPHAVTFEDRLWRVSESSAVAVGTLYRFRSDGTLEINSPGSTPMIGSWSRKGEGLVMIEESIPYQVDILNLTADSFSIRSHNPGEPVDINMVAAGDESQ